MQSKHIALALEREPSPATEKSCISLTRRALLKGTGVLFGTLAMSSALTLIAPSRAWALELKSLDEHQGKVLLALIKRIYPHTTLDDAVYALVVKDLDGKAAGAAAVRDQLAEGIRKLDTQAGGDWSTRAVVDQDRDVAALADTPFFQTVRSTAVVSLYSNALAYAHFGYGAQAGDGGYLYKGFNDLAWLPNPPEQDSGPIPAN
ncbi:tat (twin-arginine translocation) pathway signal sequence [Bordetella muralis]|uniref:tat (twin-arginine translocation) pathway signal sequence n=1 Tax=Bordetella muralis TaxID=1649130 RepID=UPI0039EE110D